MNVRWITLLFSITLCICAHSADSEQDSVDSPVKLWDSWVIEEPFVPTERDYTIEVGSMFQNDNLYWVGFGFGYNIGTCLFSDSQSCQQYIDITSGGAARDSETHGIWFGSLRWQFVNFPATFSPMARIFAGGDLLNISGKGVDYHHLGGIGIGITQYLNDRADVRMEYRFGQSHKVFSQFTFGVHIKIDKLVSYFGGKLKELGVDTLDAGGAVIEGAGDVVEETGKVITTPFKGGEEPGEVGPDKNESERSSGGTEGAEGKKRGDDN